MRAGLANAERPKLPRALWYLLPLLSAAQYYAYGVLVIVLYRIVQTDPSALTMMWTSLGWVACSAPLIGALNDGLILWGERRRPIMMAGIIINVVVWTVLYALLIRGATGGAGPPPPYHSMSTPPLAMVSFSALVTLLVVQTMGQIMISAPLNALVVDAAAVCAAAASPLPVQQARLPSSPFPSVGVTREALSLGEGIDRLQEVRDSLAQSLTAEADPSVRVGGGGTGANSALHGSLQGQAMAWRTAGSLVGALIQIGVMAIASPVTALAMAVPFYGCVAVGLYFLPSELISGSATEQAAGGPSVTTSWARAVILLCAPRVTVARRFRSTVAAFHAEFRGAVCAARKTVLACSKKNHTAETEDDYQFADASGVSRRWFCGGDAMRLIAVLLFVLTYNAVPDASVAYSEYVAVSFNFSNWFFSVMQAVGLVGGIASSLAYSRWLGTRSQSAVLVVGCLASASAYITNIALATGFATRTLRIPPAAFVLIDALFQSFFQRLCFMPVMHVAARRCPKGFEASMFELFNTMALLGSSVSGILTAVLTKHAFHITYQDWSHLPSLLWTCAAARVVPLLLVGLVPEVPTPTNSESPAVMAE